MSKIIPVRNLCYHFEDTNVKLKIYNTEYDPIVKRCRKNPSKSCFITLSDDRRMRIQLVGDKLLYYKHPDWGNLELISIDMQKQFERQIENMRKEIVEYEAVERFLVSCNDSDERIKAHYRDGVLNLGDEGNDVVWINSSSSDDSSN